MIWNTNSEQNKIKTNPTKQVWPNEQNMYAKEKLMKKLMEKSYTCKNEMI